MKAFIFLVLIVGIVSCSSQSTDDILAQLEQLETELDSMSTNNENAEIKDFAAIRLWSTDINGQIRRISKPVSFEIGNAISRFNLLRKSLMPYDSLNVRLTNEIDSAKVNIQLLKDDINNSAGTEYLYEDYVTHERNNVKQISVLVERRDSMAVIIKDVHQELFPTLELNLSEYIDAPN